MIPLLNHTVMEDDPPLAAHQQQCSSGGSVDLPDLNPGPSSCFSNGAHSGQMKPTQIRNLALKRFHQTYGITTSTAAPPAFPPSSKAKDYTERWLQNYHGPEYQQMPLSNTPSIASTSSLASNMSGLSVCTELSIITELDQSEFFPALPAIVENENLLGVPSSSSYNENIEMNLIQAIDTHFWQKFDSCDETSVMEALHFIYNVAQTKKFIYIDHAHYVDYVMNIFGALFYALTQANASQKMKNVILSTLHQMTLNRICMEALNKFIHRTKRGEVIRTICQFLKPTEKCGRFAISLLHTLLRNRLTNRVSWQHAQDQTVLDSIVNIIKSDSCNYKHLALDSLRLILYKSKLEMIFKEKGGIETCLHLLDIEAEEKVLYRAVLVLAQLLKSAVTGAYFVDKGGVQIVVKHLDHASPKLILTIAKCLSMISDSKNLSKQNINDALKCTVRLLGSRDMDLVNHATGFIANAINDNFTGRICLLECNAINDIMRLTHVLTETGLIANERQKTLDVVENVLMILKKLIYGKYDSRYVFSACLQIVTACVDTPCNLTEIEGHNFMLNVLAGDWQLPSLIILLNVIALDYFNVGSRVIMILNRIIENIPNIVSKFEFVQDIYKGYNYCTHLINALFRATEELWKTGKNATTTEDHKKLDQFEALFKGALCLLWNFITKSQNMKLQIGLICSSNKIPALLLPYLGVNPRLQLDLIQFLVMLTNDNDQLNGLWSSNEHVIKVLRDQTAQSNIPEIVLYSNVILQRLNAI